MYYIYQQGRITLRKLYNFILKLFFPQKEILQNGKKASLSFSRSTMGVIGWF